MKAQDSFLKKAPGWFEPGAQPGAPYFKSWTGLNWLKLPVPGFLANLHRLFLPPKKPPLRKTVNKETPEPGAFGSYISGRQSQSGKDDGECWCHVVHNFREQLDTKQGIVSAQRRSSRFSSRFKTTGSFFSPTPGNLTIFENTINCKED